MSHREKMHVKWDAGVSVHKGGRRETKDGKTSRIVMKKEMIAGDGHPNGLYLSSSSSVLLVPN